MSDKKCGHCKWWEKIDDQPIRTAMVEFVGSKAGFGECYRFPPCIYGGHNTQDNQPRTYESHHCGEFTPKVEGHE